MSEGYDNNNRGAGWKTDSSLMARTLRVTAEIEHRKFYGLLVRTGKPKPSNELYLYSGDNRTEVYRVAIFKSEKDGPKLAGGELTLRSGGKFWVSLFKNKSDKDNSPLVDFSFQPQDPQPESEGHPAEDDGSWIDDGTPF